MSFVPRAKAKRPNSRLRGTARPDKQRFSPVEALAMKRAGVKQRAIATHFNVSPAAISFAIARQIEREQIAAEALPEALPMPYAGKE